ncbi:hypothetical protein I2I11_08185 [Pontibacter sp. 172403-2]|uniref:capsule assembly Wzi family protein n=1 Tax=Pontibacter rufus TaxID=2791028 RepID=UPI0018AF9B7A|nr:capsule assembly Wzi family protein [Pontibacter sp. 172403-2]MBF9253267.1 hypothetical protein [Pontibacter sp. 172403-2]
MLKLYITLFLFLFCLSGYAQTGNLHYGIEAQAGVASADRVTFWLRSNRHGSVPSPGASLSLIGRAHRDYDSTRTHLVDWGAGFGGRANAGKESDLLLIEAYGKVRAGIFELKAGRTKDIMGLVDTTLSSGAFAISGNALGIPKVQLAIPEFYPLPFWGGLFAFKGNLAHGWLGEVPIGLTRSRIKEATTYFHQKSLYGRFGKPDWKLKLYAGFSHQVFWGNEDEIYPEGAFKLSPWKEYQYVVMGRRYGGGGVEVSKIGNQLGSIDLGLTYDFSKVKLFAYRQNFYDVGALYYLANILDGLNGLSLENKQHTDKKVQWQKLVFEVLYTKNQAGESWSRIVPSGDEDYYNNYMYSQGWSYRGLGLGSPFISPRASTREGLASAPGDFFINNRLLAFHLAMQGRVQAWTCTAKVSYSRNYGTYGTSVVGHSLGGTRFPPQYGIFEEVGQLSTYIEGNKALPHGLHVGFMAAVDRGGLLDNTGGLIVKFGKSW